MRMVGSSPPPPSPAGPTRVAADSAKIFDKPAGAGIDGNHVNRNRGVWVVAKGAKKADKGRSNGANLGFEAKMWAAAEEPV